MATAIGYIRVSTGKQGDSIEAQDDAIRVWCASKGLEILDMFSETISAGRPLGQRLGVLDAIDAVDEHKAAHLVAVARDRLGRDAVELAIIERMVTRGGGKISTTDGASSTGGPEGVLIRSILDAVAQFERIQISVRTRRVLQYKRRQGEKFTSQPPYGCRCVGNRFVDDPYEGQIIGLVCEWRLKGATWAAICGLLTKRQYKPRGSRWHPTTVRRIWDAAAERDKTA